MNVLNKLVSLTLRNTWKYNFTSKRSFLSSLNLGIDSFLKRRKDFQVINKLRLNEFKSKMIEASTEGNDFSVFSQDVVKMMYLAENKEDLKAVNNLLKKVSSRKLIRAVGYKCGADIMRLHYVLNEPEEAMQIIQDPLLHSEFSSNISQIIFLDLLFENNLYREVIELYPVIMRLSYPTYRNPIQLLIYFASCYKLNTSDSFGAAYNMWQHLLHSRYRPGSRLRHFFSALSLNQNELFCAMEVLPHSSSDTLTTNLKCMVLAKSKRFLDVFEYINQILESESKKKLLFNEVLHVIEEEIKSSDKDKIEEFHILKEKLFLKKLIGAETIDSSLFDELDALGEKPISVQIKTSTFNKK